MPPVCPKCGAPLEPAPSVCPSCGYALVVPPDGKVEIDPSISTPPPRRGCALAGGVLVLAVSVVLRAI